MKNGRPSFVVEHDELEQFDHSVSLVSILGLSRECHHYISSALPFATPWFTFSHLCRCYNCDERGHHAKECKLPPLPKRCHHCKSVDHLVACCTTKRDKPAALCVCLNSSDATRSNETDIVTSQTDTEQSPEQSKDKES